MADLTSIYRDYIDCLNRQDWTALGRFVQADVRHNGRALGLDGYAAMLKDDFARIPDLRFRIEKLAGDPPLVAARLMFTVTPTGEFLGLPVNGRTVTFAENIFYAFREGKIAEAWSVIDKAAIEHQLEPSASAS